MLSAALVRSCGSTIQDEAWRAAYLSAVQHALGGSHARNAPGDGEILQSQLVREGATQPGLDLGELLEASSMAESGWGAGAAQRAEPQQGAFAITPKTRARRQQLRRSKRSMVSGTPTTEMDDAVGGDNLNGLDSSDHASDVVACARAATRAPAFTVREARLIAAALDRLHLPVPPAAPCGVLWLCMPFVVL